MKKWEYRYIYVSSVKEGNHPVTEDGCRKEFERLVNQAGADGWRIKGETFYHGYGGPWSCCMEREIPEPRSPPEQPKSINFGTGKVR